ncbi:error-prone DNA polymerase [Pseudobowmanella zhangzhouensis]|uniref:Error-prone DNA polymerase n=1 Tax=Pseudobowmanella zhangzhouensis TaxID=1537679 RepID=A0ABW1XEB5_9ALTE
MAYAELFCQSNFSFLQGASHPEELVRQAYFHGYRALAITDECSVAGVVRAYTEIKQNQLDIQLIVGSYFQLSELQIVLLCPNRQAYAELCRIITNARRRCKKGEYQLTEWDLKTIKHCLVLWLPIMQDSDHQWARWLTKHHGERCWLAVQRHLSTHDQRYLNYCRHLAEQHHLPVTCCGAVLMHHNQRLPLQHVLSAIGAGMPVHAMGRKLLPNGERSLRPVSKVHKLFPPDWIAQTLMIATRCQFQLSELRYQYPAELVPQGKTASEYLRELVELGILRRFGGEPDAPIRAIIEKELQLIGEQQYEYFFLTIYDIVQFAKQRDILYQGRGSAANSVVCYCLEITAVDPRQINVLFERFISKERDEPPDIDVDFEHQRREEIIQYIYQKYGRERTALAATVICYRFKSAVREVGKALGINLTELEFFIKNVNRRDRAQPWQAQIAGLGLDPSSPQGQRFIQLVSEIIGFPRHLSQHVGGFVISASPLYELVPVENAAMPQRTVIQWDKDDLESLQLLKVDILALGMLSAIRRALQLIERHYGHYWQLADITRLGDDRQVYQMVQRADTVGVFQIESRAQMSMLPRLKPASYYDLVIQIAIVRPGPIQGDMVHPFLRRREGHEAVEYPSEEVKSVLARTMGVPIFQEQVIQLAMVAASFSGGEADQLRRAMASWKKNGKLLQFKTKLTEGMRQRGYNADFAERIFNQILGFGEYGFPESHSASFAVLAYVSAWLKHYYPAAFYCALLNSWPMGFYSPSQLVQDARRHGITILPVCINHSGYEHAMCFHQQRWAIRLGLTQIKGLHASSAELIERQRPSTGYQHIRQIQALGLNRQQLEALASANALASLSGDRFATRWTLMDQEPSLPLLADLPAHHSPLPHQPNQWDTLIEDINSTGLTLHQHPVRLLRDAGLLPKFITAGELTSVAHKSVVSVCGIVSGRQSPGTASGVTFVTLEDDTGNVNVVVWLAVARAQKQALLKARILFIKGILERGDGGVVHVIAGQLQDKSALLAQLHATSRDFH